MFIELKEWSELKQLWINKPLQVPHNIEKKIRSLVKVGEVIPAIKYVREALGVGLKDAKNFVDLNFLYPPHQQQVVQIVQQQIVDTQIPKLKLKWEKSR